ncbi:Cobalt-precorrin-2 C(20)-methyltransferase [Methanoculleus chikugoensis]|uniref:Cobalt-precorrin-2 C(20)-methyltransferase n=1 Tax=Methanoculleus chikugoensis TaxID=118126 RepID=A0A1M4ML76_9EURY|nr:cobalt-factor II C(20)-methyltransferase [Methanoculleus chikugoensis]MDD4567154.1 cobalt-factor II C(20)-methyltransferase [Methanoculleus chikugoensis]SCL75587.1 Cobalt-precorrin-2 C(20)-methyltransferase [Methanoculleus chikugoensis]
MLVGVGLGPGDPELLTLRAVRLLGESAAVFVPGNLAYDLVKPYRPDAVVLNFPMTNDEDYIRTCMEENADRIAPHAEDGLTVFGIIGDPNFYSTFSRLCEVIATRYPEITFATEPGISSITAFASVANVPVAGGFLVSDGNGPESRIFMKVRKPAALAASLSEEGYSEFVLVERMFMPEQRVYRGGELPEKSDYFSILFARRPHA